MRPPLLLLALLASVAVSAQPEGEGYYHTRGTRLVSPDGQPDVLRGIGLGGWLMPEGYMVRVPGHGSPTTIRQQAVEVAGEEGADRYFEAFRANYVREEDIQKIAEWGYDHVRLPFHYKVLWDEEAGAFDEDGFALVDAFLEWCREAGLPVIFDMHAAPGGQSEHNIADAHGTAELWVGPNAAVNQALTIRIWEEIARRYRDDRLVIGYDIINEPVLPEGVTRAELRDFYVRSRDAIRAIDPHHVLFIEGDFFANFFDGLTPAFDDNMVWAFHKYWSPTDPADMTRFVELRDSTGVPLWLGETGENSNDWFHEVATWAVENGIGWNWWTHKKIETVTSPLSAPMQPGYRDLVAYWRGEAPKPDRETAEAALLAQAAALHIDSTAFRPDVLWSLFDPAWATLAVPFKPHTLPGTLDAVDYDLGADGVGYHDTRSKNEQGTPGLANEGGVYRNDGVDIAANERGGPAYRVGWTEAGEWLQYTVRVPAGGTFAASATVTGGAGQLALEVDGESWGEAAVPASGGTWAEVDLGTHTLSAGPHVLRVRIREGGFDVGRLTFDSTD
ncbi:cellulase family glycosylhydrolase [Rubrivirga marina]|uniref:CBM6 domain-containing protein n=1 Tax=Rubrivirga marina TaxID=1196024 RepID=A0A271J341_9BACT|nr:cellulase family glycosylhydrolase [Rubrivirga marina]PAP77129.1 hypothetical protein BSZ37_12175 [Rubrivirga marina]